MILAEKDLRKIHERNDGLLQMKPTLFFLAILFLTVPSAAQSECGLKLKDAPAFFGLKLGLAAEEAQAVLGQGFKIKPKKSGEFGFFQDFTEQPATGVLSGVRAVYLRFFNHKLYQIEIFYEDKAEWKTLEDFTKSLPVYAGTTWNYAKGKAEINCGEFTLVARKVLNPSIELTDELTRAEFEKKRLAKKK